MNVVGLGCVGFRTAQNLAINWRYPRKNEWLFPGCEYVMYRLYRLIVSCVQYVWCVSQER